MFRKIVSKIRSLIKAKLLPYKPLEQGIDVWEHQFKQGHWGYLGDINQVARYSIIAGINDYFYNGKSNILDLGCGQGVLLERLKNQDYKLYVGVDLSQNAIDLASAKANDRSEFTCGKIETFEPEQKFDLIVFNESLYYLKDPVETIKKFSNFLNPDGKIIVSMWDYKERNNKLWSLVDKNFIVIDDLHLQKIQTKSAWIIKVIQKKAKVSNIKNDFLLSFSIPFLNYVLDFL